MFMIVGFRVFHRGGIVEVELGGHEAADERVDYNVFPNKKVLVDLCFGFLQTSKKMSFHFV